jgi:hypothetical protein
MQATALRRRDGKLQNDPSEIIWRSIQNTISRRLGVRRAGVRGSKDGADDGNHLNDISHDAPPQRHPAQEQESAYLAVVRLCPT